VKLHFKMVNVVNISVGNNSKSSSLRGDVISPNNNFDKEDNLEGI